jgi:uncharacterized membrane protein HdeD (DUF308 family)
MDFASQLFQVLGVAAIVAGVALISVPAALIVAGVLLCATGAAVEFYRLRNRP